MEVRFAHHSVAPARQGIEGEGAVFFGDRVAQVLQTLVLGLEPRHRGEKSLPLIKYCDLGFRLPWSPTRGPESAPSSEA